MRPLLPWLSVVGLAAAGAWAHERGAEPAWLEAPPTALDAAPLEEPSLTLRGCSRAREVNGDAGGTQPQVPDASADVEIVELVPECCPTEDPTETGSSTLLVRVTD